MAGGGRVADGGTGEASCPESELNQRFSKAIMNFNAELSGCKTGTLVQVWMPELCSDGTMVLQTQGLPFSVSGVGDLLALFRCVSCRYRFATDTSKPQLMGAIGRVYVSAEPEMCWDVQRYDKSVYLRVCEAQRCRIHSTLVMPVFLSKARDKPAAVVEVSHHDRDVKFPTVVSRLISCLESVNLRAADVEVSNLRYGLRKWPVDMQTLEEGMVKKEPQTLEAPEEDQLPEYETLDTALQSDHVQPEGFILHSSSSGHSHDNAAAASMPANNAGKEGAELQGRCSPSEQQTKKGNEHRVDQFMGSEPGNDNQSQRQSETSGHNEEDPGSCQTHRDDMVCEAPANPPDLARQSTSNVNAANTNRQPTGSGCTSGFSGESGGGADNGATSRGAERKERELRRSSSGSSIGKKNDNRLGGGAGKRLTYKDLEAQFGVGLKEAASRLGICPTTLKRACRRNGISRWPSRQIAKLNKAWNQMGYPGAPPSWLLQNAIAGNLKADNLAFTLNAGLHVGLIQHGQAGGAQSQVDMRQCPQAGNLPSTFSGGSAPASIGLLSSGDTDSIRVGLTSGHGIASLTDQAFHSDMGSIVGESGNHTWHAGQMAGTIVQPSFRSADHRPSNATPSIVLPVSAGQNPDFMQGMVPEFENQIEGSLEDTQHGAELIPLLTGLDGFPDNQEGLLVNLGNLTGDIAIDSMDVSAVNDVNLAGQMFRDGR